MPSKIIQQLPLKYSPVVTITHQLDQDPIKPPPVAKGQKLRMVCT